MLGFSNSGGFKALIKDITNKSKQSNTSTEAIKPSKLFKSSDFLKGALGKLKIGGSGGKSSSRGFTSLIKNLVNKQKKKKTTTKSTIPFKASGKKGPIRKVVDTTAGSPNI